MKKYNLIHEKWIQVIDSKKGFTQVSIGELFENAHEIVQIVGDTCLQVYSCIRMLLAILITVYYRYDTDGIERDMTNMDEDEVFDFFKEVWDSGRFPMKAISKYLDSQEDSFWLFHPDRPFFQTPGGDKYTWNSLSKLDGTMLESGNKANLFTMTYGSLMESMPYDDAVRNLISIYYFDDTSCHPGTGIGWMGQLSNIYAIGNNVFETLMLNCVLLKNGEEPWGACRPIWEKPLCLEKAKEIVIPDNQPELLTFPSRRIILKEKDGAVTEFGEYGGEVFEKSTAIRYEQFTLWHQKKNGEFTSFLPVPTHIWKELPSLISHDNSDIMPGVVKWSKYLQNRGIINNAVVNFANIHVEYGSCNCVVNDIYYNTISFNSFLLTDFGLSWSERIREEIQKIDNCSRSLWAFKKTVACHGKDTESKDKTIDAKANKSVDEFYANISHPFLIWLHSIDDKSDEQTFCKEWEEKSREICLDIGKDTMKRLPSKLMLDEKINESYSKYIGSIFNNYPIRRKDKDEDKRTDL